MPRRRCCSVGSAEADRLQLVELGEGERKVLITATHHWYGVRTGVIDFAFAIEQEEGGMALAPFATVQRP